MLLPATGIYLREDSQSCADTCIRIRRLSTNVVSTGTKKNTNGGSNCFGYMFPYRYSIFVIVSAEYGRGRYRGKCRAGGEDRDGDPCNGNINRVFYKR